MEFKWSFLDGGLNKTLARRNQNYEIRYRNRAGG